MVRFRFIILIIITLGCSSELPRSEPNLNFYLDRSGTVTGTIFVNFEADDDQQYLVAFTSDDSSLYFIADETSPAIITGSSQIPVTTDVKGIHSFNFHVFALDGSVIASDTYEFVYQYDIISEPIITFSEKATKDQYVSLQLSTASDPLIDQMWIEGDVINDYKNKWLPIDILNQLSVTLLPGEGQKNIQAKVRNSIGAESELQSLSIMLDETDPNACQVEFAATTIGSPFVNVRFSGNDETGLSYGVAGSVPTIQEGVEFTSGDNFWIPVTNFEGDKNLTFYISDDAENYCLIETHTVTFDETHAPYGVDIAGDLIYTYSRDISVDVRIDSFNKSQYQIYFAGGIESIPNGKTWLPHQETTSLRLASGEGTRMVYMKINDAGTESNYVVDTIYLNPTMRITSGTPSKIHLPNIIETDSITIIGCVETLVNISHQQSINCTPNAPKAVATLYFTNGTNLVLEEFF